MSEAVSESPVATPKGIRGWLILPAFGTCISPLFLIASLVATMPNYDRVWNLRGRLPAGLMAFISVEFIGNLAFPDPSKASEVRLGVLGGSILSAVLGFVILRYVAKPAVAASAFAPSPTRH